MRIRLVRGLLLATALVGLGANTGSAQDATPTPGTPSVLESRTFSLEGRYVALSPDGMWLATLNVETDELCAVPTSDLGTEQGADATKDAASCASLAAYDVNSVSITTAKWSPDSTRLAFTEDGAVRLVDADIWVFIVATGELINLTDDGVNAGVPFGNEEGVERLDMDLLPTWSPDGETIAFARSPWMGGWQGTQIATVPADGSADAEILAPINLMTPFAVYFGMTYSPDGADLYFTVAYSNPDERNNGVWRLSLADGSATQLAGRTDPERGYPTVSGMSPLGDRVLTYDALYASQFGNAASAYAYLDTETNELQPITASPADQPMAANPVWATFSPDGEWLAFVASGSRLRSVLKVRPSGDLGPDRDTVLLDGADDVVFTSVAWGSNGVMVAMVDPSAGYLLHLSGGNTPPAPIAPEPAPEPTPEPTPGPEATPTTRSPVDPTTVTAGTELVTNDNASLRSAPNPNDPIARELLVGTPVTAIGPAEKANGFTWIPVREPATGTIGYVRSELLSSAEVP